jgi:hypothetical protein
MDREKVRKRKEGRKISLRPLSQGGWEREKTRKRKEGREREREREKESLEFQKVF